MLHDSPKHYANNSATKTPSTYAHEELLEANRELHNANAELADDNHKLHAQLTDVQDDLIAVRASLRQMIRDTTGQMETT